MIFDDSDAALTGQNQNDDGMLGYVFDKYDRVFHFFPLPGEHLLDPKISCEIVVFAGKLSIRKL